MSTRTRTRPAEGNPVDRPTPRWKHDQKQEPRSRVRERVHELTAPAFLPARPEEVADYHEGSDALFDFRLDAFAWLASRRMRRLVQAAWVIVGLGGAHLVLLAVILGRVF